MTSHSSIQLSIPLNGFLNHMVYSAVAFNTSFNSIEWIPDDSVHHSHGRHTLRSFNSIEWIPTGSFVTGITTTAGTTFNSIEWILDYWYCVSFYVCWSFNSIEWIQGNHISPHAQYTRSFQFHWMDSGVLEVIQSRFYPILSIPLNGFLNVNVTVTVCPVATFQFHWMDSYHHQVYH